MRWIAFPIQVKRLDTEVSVRLDKTRVKKANEKHVHAQNEYINVRTGRQLTTLLCRSQLETWRKSPTGAQQCYN